MCTIWNHFERSLALIEVQRENTPNGTFGMLYRIEAVGPVHYWPRVGCDEAFSQCMMAAIWIMSQRDTRTVTFRDVSS